MTIETRQQMTTATAANSTTLDAAKKAATRARIISTMLGALATIGVSGGVAMAGAFPIASWVVGGVGLAFGLSALLVKLFSGTATDAELTAMAEHFAAQSAAFIERAAKKGGDSNAK